MPCTSPLKAFRSVDKHESTGKPVLTFNPIRARNSTNPLVLPCGQCMGCRIDRSRDWALRCHHEAAMHAANSFVTLTYSDEHLPSDYSVSVRAFQLFMKRLRKSLGSSVRYFACGEYGDDNLRPHYHALIFGSDFSGDRQLYSRSPQLYSSPLLSAAWPYGRALLGDVTYQSAAYVARYCVKKITGDQADTHYLRIHPRLDQVVRVQPEFSVQSRRPGIGARWYDRYSSDAFPSDFLITDGKRHRVPRYYASKLADDELARLKRVRKRKSLPHKANNTPQRLAARAAVLSAKVSMLKRSLKDDQ